MEAIKTEGLIKKYKDIKIVNLDKLTYAGNPENLKEFENNENYVFIKEDICNAEAVNKIFQEYDIDRVVKNPEIFVQTNVIGTTVLLNAARNAWEQEDGTYKEGKKFLHVSTDEVYGSLEEDGTFFYETTPYSPHSPYSASKAS